MTFLDDVHAALDPVVTGIVDKLTGDLANAQAALSLAVTQAVTDKATIDGLKAQVADLTAKLAAATAPPVVVPPVVVPPVVIPPVVVPPVGAIVPGWFRTAKNTGLAGVGLTSADLTAYTGSLTITGDVYRKIINLGTNGQIRLNGGTLRQCLITGSKLNDGLIYLDDSGAGFQSIIDCDIVGTGGTGGESKGIIGWASQGFKLVRTKITGTTIFVWLDGFGTAPDLIDQCYFSQQVSGGSSHHDGVTRRNGMNPLIIQNTRIDCSTSPVTGAVFLQPDKRPVGNVTVQDSYLEGQGFCATLENSSDVTFRRNRFRSTGWGPVTTTGMVRLTWADNYTVDTTQPDLKGATITA